MNEGRLFSSLYIERGAPTKDSVRFRNRLASFFSGHINETNEYKIGTLIERELGVDVEVGGYYLVSEFLRKCELRDLLDSVTLIYFSLNSVGLTNLSNGWRDFVKRVLYEENLGYRIDSECGVHYFVDEEFERSRVASLSCLSKDKFSAALAAFESTFKALDRSPSDTVSAIRSLFESVEIVYKLVFNSDGKSRLNSFAIQKEIKPAFQQRLLGNDVAIKAMDHFLDGFCDWTEAAHMYRHGQKIEEPQPPSMEFVVAFISQGASFIRLLTSLA